MIGGADLGDVAVAASGTSGDAKLSTVIPPGKSGAAFVAALYSGDAANLAWKLDLVLSGKASEELLDSYVLERKPHVRAIIDQAVALGRIVCVSDPVEAALRDAAIRGGLAPPPPPFPHLTGGVLHHEPDGVLGLLAGQLGPQGVVVARAGVGRCDDIVGRGWSLLTFDQEVWRSFVEVPPNAVRRLGLRALLLLSERRSDCSDGVAFDMHRTYRRFFDDWALLALIVRPDFYIYGAARTAIELTSVIEGLTAQCAVRDPDRIDGRTHASTIRHPRMADGNDDDRR